MSEHLYIHALLSSIISGRYSFIRKFGQDPDLCVLGHENWDLLFSSADDPFSFVNKLTGEVIHELKLNGDHNYYLMGMRFIKSCAMDNDYMVLTMNEDVNINKPIPYVFAVFEESNKYIIKGECRVEKPFRLMVIDLKQ